jgi:hypothetical protein
MENLAKKNKQTFLQLVLKELLKYIFVVIF